MINRLLIAPIFLVFFLLLAGLGECGVIRTTVTLSHTVTGPGRIEMQAEIKNEGDAAAYKIGVTVFMGDWSKRIDGLGDLLPDNTVRFAEIYENSDLKPGSYNIVLRVDYEEGSGLKHKIFHFSSLQYQPEGNEMPTANLLNNIEAPRFNPKVLWGRTEPLKLIMKNEYPDPVAARINLYLPEGFSGQKLYSQLGLGPGEEKTAVFPVVGENFNYSGRPFNLIVEYEAGGRHYSDNIRGNFIVDEKPLYLKLYLSVGLFCLALMFLLGLRKEKA